jgi:hypothetical protein
MRWALPRVLPLVVGTLCLASIAWAGGPPLETMRGPGPGSSARPPLQSQPPDFRETSRDAEGVGAGLLLGVLGFYRNVVSTVDGDRCSMAPTCSLYSRDAIHAHGAWVGTLLTADRLLHEADEIPLVPTIDIGGETHYLDPLEANTYWW